MIRRLLGIAATLLALAVPALAQIPTLPQTLPANTVVGRTGIGPGPAQVIPFSLLIQNLANTSNSWQALQSFNAGIAIGPTNQVPAITTTHDLSGSAAFGEACVGLCINVNSDTIAAGLGVNDIVINHSFGGTSLTGTRTGALIILTQTAPASSLNPLPAYTGIAPVVVINAGAATSIDTYFGANPQVRSSAAGARQLTGQETDVWGTSAATQLYQLGHTVEGLFVNNGTTADIAFAFYMGASTPYGAASAPGPGWKCGFCAAEFDNGYVPIASTGTFIGVHLESLMTVPVAYGVDIRGLTASTSDMIGQNWSISPAGAVTGSSLVSNGGSATLGINGSNGASLALANGGGSGAFAVIKNPSTTSTYNFNLPATAGSAGNVLASGGGSTSPMTWINGVSTVCTVTAGNSLTFTNGVLTTKGANCT
jgi:hypothetical protein